MHEMSREETRGQEGKTKGRGERGGSMHQRDALGTREVGREGEDQRVEGGSRARASVRRFKLNYPSRLSPSYI